MSDRNFSILKMGILPIGVLFLMLAVFGGLGFLLCWILIIGLVVVIIANTLSKDRHSNGLIGPFREFVIVMITFSVVILMCVPVLPGGIQKQVESASAAKAHNLGIAAFNYANDNNQTYPFGASSTEIFQTLYNGKYLREPREVSLKPKVESWLKVFYSTEEDDHSNRLKPENVSWDFNTQKNSGLSGADPTDLPLLFSDVDTAPNWKAGVNNVTITASSPWGTKGVTMCTLDQAARFVRAGTVPGQVSLTQPSFIPMPNVTYVTRKP